MVGVELYHGNSPLDGKTMMNIKHELLYKGLLMHTCGHFSNVFRFMGALNIPDNELREGIKIFSQVLSSDNFKAGGQ
jgi:4-aminobutyrate aminotransferase-like enzyme